MARIFYTEKDIEDMVNQGIQSQEITSDMTLTGLAYEKARALGLRLVQEKLDELPNAPVRPYLNKIPTPRQAAAAAAPTPAAPVPPPSATPASEPSDLQARITKSVIAKMGGEVDAVLLESIVRRVLSSTGLK